MIDDQEQGCQMIKNTSEPTMLSSSGSKNPLYFLHCSFTYLTQLASDHTSTLLWPWLYLPSYGFHLSWHLLSIIPNKQKEKTEIYDMFHAPWMIEHIVKTPIPIRFINKTHNILTMKTQVVFLFKRYVCMWYLCLCVS